jgi:VanZ family protein
MMAAMERGTLPVWHKSAGGFRLAWILALAYTLLIAYASLQPFRAWRNPPPEVLGFLTAPWPHFITLEDVLINLAAYAPLGFMLAIALRGRFTARVSVLVAALAATGVSLAMESAQMFLPARIASNVDLLTNGTGALFGAMAAPLLSPSRFPGQRLAAWREGLFATGTAADTGLVIVGMWLLTHLHPTAQAFGTGNLRNTFELPAYFIHTPLRLISAEASIVLFNLLGLGLLIAAVSQNPRRAFTIVAAIVAVGLAVRAIAAMTLFNSPGPFTWLTPGVALGLLAGALALYPLLRVPQTAMLFLAIFTLGAAVAVINFAPDNPYQTIPPKLLPGATTHLLRFSSIARALSELWPFLAIAYLVAATLGLRPQRDYRL